MCVCVMLKKKKNGGKVLSYFLTLKCKCYHSHSLDTAQSFSLVYIVGMHL